MTTDDLAAAVARLRKCTERGAPDLRVDDLSLVLSALKAAQAAQTSGSTDGRAGYSRDAGHPTAPPAAGIKPGPLDHQNGVQRHEASAGCALGASSLESGNAREATCLNGEHDARRCSPTQQGQLGTNAGSIPAAPTDPIVDLCARLRDFPSPEYIDGRPTATDQERAMYDAAPAPSADDTGANGEPVYRPKGKPPAAQPAAQRALVRVPCPNKVDGVCPLPNVHCAYPKCTEGTAPLSHVTPAGPPAPPAQAATDDLPKLGLTRWGRKANGNVYEMPDGYWTPWHIADKLLQRQAREIAELRDVVTAFQRSQQGLVRDLAAALAERDALRECVRAADAMREIHAGYFKTQDPERNDEMKATRKAYDAARAKVKLP